MQAVAIGWQIYALTHRPLSLGLLGLAQFLPMVLLIFVAGHAADRYYSDPEGRRLGMLDSRVDLEPVEGINLTDEWLDLAVGLRWSIPGGLWCLPVETVSQSEGGFEGVYQSSAVVARWRVEADESRRWEVRILWSIGRARPVVADAEEDRATPEWSMADDQSTLSR